MNRTLATILLLLACYATADTLLVVNRRDATLALVDPAAMKVTGKIATGEEPHEVAVSDDGKIAVVGNLGLDRIPARRLRSSTSARNESCAGSRCPDSLGRTAFRQSVHASTSRPREASQWRAMTRRRIVSTGLSARDRI